MKVTNIVVDNAFRAKSDLLLTLFSVIGAAYDAAQMSLAIGADSDVLVQVEYADELDTLMQCAEKHKLIRTMQSYENLTWEILSRGEAAGRQKGA